MDGQLDPQAGRGLEGGLQVIDDKNVELIMLLLRRSGYPTTRMTRRFRELGAKIDECSHRMRVETWVRCLSRGDAAAVTDRLKRQLGEPEQWDQPSAWQRREELTC